MRFVIGTWVLLGFVSAGWTQEKSAPTQGQRVFTAGHSFHVFMPAILSEVAKSAGLAGHTQVGMSSIGGSRVIQHWNKEDDKNQAKKVLKGGEVDVFTMSPIFLPDEGIENFVKLAVAGNPKVRVTVQEFWMPFDAPREAFENRTKKAPDKLDRDAKTIAELRQVHVSYFDAMDAEVRRLNKQYGDVVRVVPVGQAVLGLREKVIAGQAPGVAKQSELFTDPLGHVHAPIRVLSAYCHYGVIYAKSPVGLPIPKALGKESPTHADLNRLLQQLAWDAVTAHPLSGVRK